MTQYCRYDNHAADSNEIHGDLPATVSIKNAVHTKERNHYIYIFYLYLYLYFIYVVLKR